MFKKLLALAAQAALAYVTPNKADDVAAAIGIISVGHDALVAAKQRKDNKAAALHSSGVDLYTAAMEQMEDARSAQKEAAKVQELIDSHNVPAPEAAK